MQLSHLTIYCVFVLSNIFQCGRQDENAAKRRNGKQCFFLRVCVLAHFGSSAKCVEESYIISAASVTNVPLEIRDCSPGVGQTSHLGWYIHGLSLRWISNCWDQSYCLVQIAPVGRPVGVGVLLESGTGRADLLLSTCFIRPSPIHDHLSQAEKGECGKRRRPGLTRGTDHQPTPLYWALPLHFLQQFKRLSRDKQTPQHPPTLFQRRKRSSLDDKLADLEAADQTSQDVVKDIIFSGDTDSSDLYTGQLSPDEKIWDADLPTSLDEVMTFPDDYMNRVRIEAAKAAPVKVKVKVVPLVKEIPQFTPTGNVMPMKTVKDEVKKIVAATAMHNVTQDLHGQDMLKALEDHIDQKLQSSMDALRMAQQARDKEEMSLVNSFDAENKINSALAADGKPPVVVVPPSNAVSKTTKVVAVKVKTSPPKTTKKPVAKPATAKPKPAPAPAKPKPAPVPATTSNPAALKTVEFSADDDPEEAIDSLIQEHVTAAEDAYIVALSRLNDQIHDTLLVRLYPQRRRLLRTIMDNVHFLMHAAAWSMVNEVCEEPLERMAVLGHGWEEWSEWGPCTATCGPLGYHIRRRSCRAEQLCTGSNYDIMPCKKMPVCKGISTWMPWSEWGECTVGCSGVSVQTRTRACLSTQPALPCPGPNFQTTGCEMACVTKVKHPRKIGRIKLVKRLREDMRDEETRQQLLKKRRQLKHKIRKEMERKAKSKLENEIRENIEKEEAAEDETEDATEDAMEDIKDKVRKKKVKKKLKKMHRRRNKIKKRKKNLARKILKESEEIKRHKRKKRHKKNGKQSKIRKRRKIRKLKKVRRGSKIPKQSKIHDQIIISPAYLAKESLPSSTLSPASKAPKRMKRKGKWSYRHHPVKTFSHRERRRHSHNDMDDKELEKVLDDMDGMDANNLRPLKLNYNPKAVEEPYHALTPSESSMGAQPGGPQGNETLPHWTSWGKWSMCPVSCGSGTQFRWRQCVKKVKDSQAKVPVASAKCGGTQTRKDIQDCGGVSCSMLVSLCDNNPCRNNGTCEVLGKVVVVVDEDEPIRYRCHCQEGFFGRECEQKSLLHGNRLHVKLMAIVLLGLILMLCCVCSVMWISYRLQLKKNKAETKIPILAKKHPEDEWHKSKTMDEKGGRRTSPTQKPTPSPNTMKSNEGGATSQQGTVLGSNQTGFAQTSPAQTSPAQTSPAQTSPAQIGFAQTSPAPIGSAQTSPALTAPASNAVHPVNGMKAAGEKPQNLNNQRMVSNLSEPSQLEKEVSAMLEDASQNATPPNVEGVNMLGENDQATTSGTLPTRLLNSPSLHGEKREGHPRTSRSKRGKKSRSSESSTRQSALKEVRSSHSIHHRKSTSTSDPSSTAEKPKRKHHSKKSRRRHDEFNQNNSDDSSACGSDPASKSDSDSLCSKRQHSTHQSESSTDPSQSGASSNLNRSGKSHSSSDAGSSSSRHRSGKSSEPGTSGRKSRSSTEAGTSTNRSSSRISCDTDSCETLGESESSRTASTEQYAGEGCSSEGIQSGKERKARGSRHKGKSSSKHRKTTRIDEMQPTCSTANAEEELAGGHSSRHRASNPRGSERLGSYHVQHPDEPYPYRQSRLRRRSKESVDDSDAHRDESAVLRRGLDTEDRERFNLGDPDENRMDWGLDEMDCNQRLPNTQLQPAKHLDGGGEGVSLSIARTDVRRSSRDVLLRRAMENSFIKATGGHHSSRSPPAPFARHIFPHTRYGVDNTDPAFSLADEEYPTKLVPHHRKSTDKRRRKLEGEQEGADRCDSPRPGTSGYIPRAWRDKSVTSTGSQDSLTSTGDTASEAGEVVRPNPKPARRIRSKTSHASSRVSHKYKQDSDNTTGTKSVMRGESSSHSQKVSEKVSQAEKEDVSADASLAASLPVKDSTEHDTKMLCSVDSQQPEPCHDTPAHSHDKTTNTKPEQCGSMLQEDRCEQGLLTAQSVGQSIQTALNSEIDKEDQTKEDTAVETATSSSFDQQDSNTCLKSALKPSCSKVKPKFREKSPCSRRVSFIFNDSQVNDFHHLDIEYSDELLSINDDSIQQRADSLATRIHCYPGQRTPELCRHHSYKTEDGTSAQEQFDTISRRPCGPLDLDVFFSEEQGQGSAWQRSPVPGGSGMSRDRSQEAARGDGVSNSLVVLEPAALNSTETTSGIPGQQSTLQDFLRPNIPTPPERMRMTRTPQTGKSFAPLVLPNHQHPLPASTDPGTICSHSLPRSITPSPGGRPVPTDPSGICKHSLSRSIPPSPGGRPVPTDPSAICNHSLSRSIPPSHGGRSVPGTTVSSLPFPEGSDSNQWSLPVQYVRDSATQYSPAAEGEGEGGPGCSSQSVPSTSSSSSPPRPAMTFEDFQQMLALRVPQAFFRPIQKTAKPRKRSSIL